jgi:hypothetical protein
MKAISYLAIIALTILLIGVVSAAPYTTRPTVNATYAPLPTVNTSRYNNITTALHLGNATYTNATPEWYTAITQTFYVFFDAIGGPIALTLIFSLPFVMSFVGGKSLRLTAIIGLIVSPFMLIFLPANYAAAAGLCIIIAAAGLIWSVIKP